MYVCIYYICTHKLISIVRLLNDGNESGLVNKLSIWGGHMFWYHHQWNSIFECVFVLMVLESMQENSSFCTFLLLKVLFQKNTIGNNERRIVQAFHTSSFWAFQSNGKLNTQQKLKLRVNQKEIFKINISNKSKSQSKCRVPRWAHFRGASPLPFLYLIPCICSFICPPLYYDMVPLGCLATIIMLLHMRAR